MLILILNSTFLVFFLLLQTNSAPGTVKKLNSSPSILKSKQKKTSYNHVL